MLPKVAAPRRVEPQLNPSGGFNPWAQHGVTRFIRLEVPHGGNWWFLLGSIKVVPSEIAGRSVFCSVYRHMHDFEYESPVHGHSNIYPTSIPPPFSPLKTTWKKKDIHTTDRSTLAQWGDFRCIRQPITRDTKLERQESKRFGDLLHWSIQMQQPQDYQDI